MIRHLHKWPSSRYTAVETVTNMRGRYRGVPSELAMPDVFRGPRVNIAVEIARGTPREACETESACVGVGHDLATVATSCHNMVRLLQLAPLAHYSIEACCDESQSD